MLRNSSPGDVFALRDRNEVSAPWRKVFVVRDEGNDQFVLFNDEGKLIDEEVQEGLPNGRHGVENLVEEFSEEGFFYGPPFSPTSSPGLRLRNRHVSTPQRLASAAHVEPNTPAPPDVPPVVVAASGDGGSCASSSMQIEEQDQSSQCDVAVVRDAVAAVAGESSERAAEQPNEQNDKEEAPMPDKVDEIVDASNGIRAAAEEISEAAASPARCVVSVGSRVCIKLPFGKTCGGMVASISEVSFVVAKDDGRWSTELLSDLGNTVVLEDESSEPKENGVVALSYDNANKVVTGMLLGSTDEGALGGKIHAYCAHVAIPQDDSTHRGRGGDAKRQVSPSFALGDHVQQLTRVSSRVSPSRPHTFAAVVRVLHSRRGVSQARRLLILVELDAELKLICNDSNPPLFFPASWANWTRHTKKSTLNVDDIARLDQV